MATLSGSNEPNHSHRGERPTEGRRKKPQQCDDSHRGATIAGLDLPALSKSIAIYCKEISNCTSNPQPVFRSRSWTRRPTADSPGPGRAPYHPGHQGQPPGALADPERIGDQVRRLRAKPKHAMSDERGGGSSGARRPGRSRRRAGWPRQSVRSAHGSATCRDSLTRTLLLLSSCYALGCRMLLKVGMFGSAKVAPRCESSRRWGFSLRLALRGSDADGEQR